VKIAPGFQLHRSGPRNLVVTADLESAAREIGLLDPGGLERLLAQGIDGLGRGRNAVVPLPGRDERLHLRPFRHGGSLAFLMRGRLTGPSRPLAELAANVRLVACGAPVPRPALVYARRVRPGVWSAAVGTIHEEAAQNALEYLTRTPDRDELHAVAAAAGGSVRRFHDTGGRHADLHVGNLIIRKHGSVPRVWLVDLDRARVAADVSPRRRMREVMRLYRSLEKRKLLDVVDQRTRASFWDGYTAGDAALRRGLLASLPREERRLAWHRLGYRQR
jgi:tRNA A-37 threonylcarbamoyl transferase component Bud32